MLLTTLALLLLTISCGPTAAQKMGFAPPAQNLKEAWELLEKTPNDPVSQQRYLSAFPSDYDTFLELFDLDQPLYHEAHQYIDVLPMLAKNYEREVGELLVKLGGNAHYDADAPSDLQQVTADFGSQYTETFAELIKGPLASNRAQLITFLADVENASAYPEYQRIIDHLEDLGEMDLAREFEIARQKRSTQSHG